MKMRYEVQVLTFEAGRIERMESHPYLRAEGRKDAIWRARAAATFCYRMGLGDVKFQVWDKEQERVVWQMYSSEVGKGDTPGFAVY